MVRLRSPAPNTPHLCGVISGSVPEWPKGADCKSVASSFGGPNPPAPTISAESNLLSAVFYTNVPTSEAVLNRLLLLPEEITDILYFFDFSF